MISGHVLSLWWGIPFVGVLFSIAFCPLLIPRVWHLHYGKIVNSWAIFLLIFFLIYFDKKNVFLTVLHSLLLHYVPFILLLGTLFILSGGLWIKARFKGNPIKNTLLLLGGTILANFIGTTGSCILLARPLLQANEGRLHRTHLLIFLIFLVGNIGGSLTPLGDPPLFLGYLQGVPFAWPFTYMLPLFLVMAIPLLLLFYGVDAYFYSKEPLSQKPQYREHISFDIRGKINLLLLICLVSVLFWTSLWSTSSSTLLVFGVPLLLSDIMRDFSFVVLGFLSFLLTPKECYEANKFSWKPFQEVAKIFFAIFITIIPVLAILEAKEAGALNFIINTLSNTQGETIPFYYFWITGLFSAFLDNAPTYLVFFQTAGGNAYDLVHYYPKTLLAISCGSVFMGALTYIGNAPNFMVKVLAEEEEIKMPSFFVYISISCVLLLPLLTIVACVFFL